MLCDNSKSRYYSVSQSSVNRSRFEKPIALKRFWGHPHGDTFIPP